jgi:hypothetical protein
MKFYRRFAKLFVAFFFILTAADFVYSDYHLEELLDPGHPVIGERMAFICITLTATGLAILWQDWRSTH